MKMLDSQVFQTYKAYAELVKFINDNKIVQSDILSVTQWERTYTLFYYKHTGNAK